MRAKAMGLAGRNAKPSTLWTDSSYQIFVRESFGNEASWFLSFWRSRGPRLGGLWRGRGAGIQHTSDVGRTQAGLSGRQRSGRGLCKACRLSRG